MKIAPFEISRSDRVRGPSALRRSFTHMSGETRERESRESGLQSRKNAIALQLRNWRGLKPISSAPVPVSRRFIAIDRADRPGSYPALKRYYFTEERREGGEDKVTEESPSRLSTAI